MSADLHNRDIDRVLRRRSTDRNPKAQQTDAGIAEPTLRTRKADVDHLLADVATRSVDRSELVDLMRRRGDGSVDIVRLTDEEAVILGLQRATWRMRIIGALRRARGLLRGDR